MRSTRPPAIASSRPRIQAIDVPIGGRRAAAILVQDITANVESEERIRKLAYYDPLTELPNRRLLVDRLGHAIATNARTGKHGALMFIDLDDFKDINDLLGHHNGDPLLREAGARLRGVVRESDTVARFGGDEFVILLELLAESADEALLAAAPGRRQAARAARPPLSPGRTRSQMHGEPRAW